MNTEAFSSESEINVKTLILDYSIKMLDLFKFLLIFTGYSVKKILYNRTRKSSSIFHNFTGVYCFGHLYIDWRSQKNKNQEVTLLSVWYIPKRNTNRKLLRIEMSWYWYDITYVENKCLNFSQRELLPFLRQYTRCPKKVT